MKASPSFLGLLIDLWECQVLGFMLRVRTSVLPIKGRQVGRSRTSSPRSHPTSPTADELRKLAIKQSPDLVVCRICEMQVRSSALLLWHSQLQADLQLGLLRQAGASSPAALRDAGLVHAAYTAAVPRSAVC